jgi:hypothetical protein
MRYVIAADVESWLLRLHVWAGRDLRGLGISPLARKKAFDAKLAAR